MSLLALIVVASIVAQGHAAVVAVSPNVIINVKYGKLTVLNNQQYNSFAAYANGTVWFDYSSIEDRTGHFSFIVQSYGNGTLDLRFKGGIPTVVTASSTLSNIYVSASTWQEIKYSTSQTSNLNIQFFTNPRFSLRDGALAGATAMVAVIVIRTAFMAAAKDTKERERLAHENKVIFIVFGVMIVALLIGASLFP